MADHALIKILRADRTHHGYTYREGLNVCTQPWDAGDCTPGGLYACELRHLFKWFNLYPDITEVAWVDVPAGAQVARFDTKIKASKLVLTGSMPMAEAARLALEAGANVHADDDAALRWSSENGRAEVVRLLLQAGANVHTLDDAALRSASENGHAEVVRLLLKAGANVHADYALGWSSYKGHTEVVHLLLNAGANVHASDDYALRWASVQGHTEVVRLLLQAGANVHANNDQALREASMYDPEVARLLRQGNIL